MPLWHSGKAVSVLKGHLWLDMLPFNKNGNVWDQVSTVATRFTSTVLTQIMRLYLTNQNLQKSQDKKKPRELGKYLDNSFPVTLKEDHKL